MQGGSATAGGSGTARVTRHTEREFLNFVEQLLKKQFGYISTSETFMQDRRIDLILTDKDDPLVVIIEAKQNPPQTEGRLGVVLEQILANGRAFERQYPELEVRLALAIPGVLTQQYEEVLKRSEVAVWDARQLLEWATEAGMSDYAMMILGAHAGEDREEFQKRLEYAHIGVSPLDSIPAGREHWAVYQAACSDILERLFSPPLEPPHNEHPNSSRVNRRDMIMANYATGGFWSFLRTQYKAEFIVVDAKNLTGSVTKHNILQIANYLSEGGLGLFGMIITRNGMNRSAQITQREQWLLYRKLVLVVSHVDVNQMLDNCVADRPADVVIRQLLESFRMSI